MGSNEILFWGFALVKNVHHFPQIWTAQSGWKAPPGFKCSEVMEVFLMFSLPPKLSKKKNKRISAIHHPILCEAIHTIAIVTCGDCVWKLGISWCIFWSPSAEGKMLGASYLMLGDLKFHVGKLGHVGFFNMEMLGASYFFLSEKARFFARFFNRCFPRDDQATEFRPCRDLANWDPPSPGSNSEVKATILWT